MCGPASTVKTQPQAPSACDSSSNQFKAFHQSISAARSATPVNQAALKQAINSGAARAVGPMTTEIGAYFPAATPVAFTTTHVAATPAAAPAKAHAAQHAAAPAAQNAGRKLMA